jgi:hypothetical protein
MAETPEQPKGRKIDSIAHLFLSGANSPQDKVKRVAPSTNNPRAQNRDGHDAGQPLDTHDRVSDAPEEARTPAICVFGDHLKGWQDKLFRLGRQTAWHDGPVGLVCFDHEEVRLKEFTRSEGSEAVDMRQVIEQAWASLFGTDELPDQGKDNDGKHRADEFLSRVQSTSQRVDSLWVHVDKARRVDCGDLMQYCGQALILCGPGQEDIVNTYKTMKWLQSSTEFDLNIAIFICDVSDESEARELFDKIAKTSEKFLAAKPDWIGHEQPFDSVAEAEYLVTDLDDGLFESLSKGLKNEPVIIPEAALSPQPVACSTAPDLAQSTPVRDQSLPEDKTSPRIYQPIAVDGIPECDSDLADILSANLQTWLAEFPGAMVLPVPRPDFLDPAVRFLVDQSGRLHILLPSLTEDERLLPRALAARKWLTDHFALIQSAFPQIIVDATVNVPTILISASSDGNNQKGYPLFESEASSVKRLLFLKDQSGYLILILDSIDTL